LRHFQKERENAVDKGLNLLLNFRFLGFIKTQLAREPIIRKEMEEEIVCYRWLDLAGSRI